MRRSALVFLILTFLLGSLSMTVYAKDCTEDTPVDKFGDWFGNLGKKEKVKNKNIAIRKANRLAECAEKQAREAVPKSPAGI